MDKIANRGEKDKVWEAWGTLGKYDEKMKTGSEERHLSKLTNEDCTG